MTRGLTIIAARALGLAACGQTAPLKPLPGQSMPVKPLMARATPGVDELLDAAAAGRCRGGSTNC